MTVRPVREINGSSEFCEEFLDDVVVGDDMVIGEVDGGWPIANFMLAVERAAASGGRSAVGGQRRDASSLQTWSSSPNSGAWPPTAPPAS